MFATGTDAMKQLEETMQAIEIGTHAGAAPGGAACASAGAGGDAAGAACRVDTMSTNAASSGSRSAARWPSGARGTHPLPREIRDVPRQPAVADQTMGVGFNRSDGLMSAKTSQPRCGVDHRG